MPYEVTIAAYKLAWPQRCASCLGQPDTTVKISTRNITSRNLMEAAWDVPYCTACVHADGSRPLRFGWFKSFWSTFTEKHHAVEFLSLHNSAQRFRFENRAYLEEFLRLNGSKNRSEIRVV